MILLEELVELEALVVRPVFNSGLRVPVFSVAGGTHNSRRKYDGCTGDYRALL